MKEAFVLMIWWGLFAGSHMLMSSERFRPRLVARFGEWPFRGIYSLVALATFIPLAHYYAHHKNDGWQLWRTLGPYLLARDLNLVLMVLAFALLVAGLIARPPSGMVTSGVPEPYGITRITRHPTFAAIWLFGIAHCLVNGRLIDLVFFGGFAVFAWIGAAHQDTRKMADIPGYAEFHAATSFVPFAAIWQKKQRLVREEIRWGAIIAGIIIFYLIRAFHPSLFGGVLMTL